MGIIFPRLYCWIYNCQRVRPEKLCIHVLYCHKTDDGNLRTDERKLENFCIFLKCSQILGVFYGQYNTWFWLLYVLQNIDLTRAK